MVIPVPKFVECDVVEKNKDQATEVNDTKEHNRTDPRLFHVSRDTVAHVLDNDK